MENCHEYRGSAVGMSLVEAIVVFTVVTLMVAVTLPGLGEARRAASLGAAARRVQGVLFRCRVHAVMKARATGVVFEKRSDQSWRVYIAEDGDGDGILRRDITSGVDPVVGEILHVDADGAGLGILQGEFVPDPSGRGRLRGNLEDPVRAGRGDIITFTPRGTATPSSIYFSDRQARMRVLRIYGSTGRVISFVWRSGWPKWREAAM